MDKNKVNQIIKELGGSSNVAKIFGISIAAVSKWKKVGEIPKPRLMYLEVKYPKIFKVHHDQK